MENKKNWKDYLKLFFHSFIWLFLLMFALDVISKQIIIANRVNILSSGPEGYVLIPNFLAVSYVINHNVAFGIQIGNNPLATRIIYIIIALLASAGLVTYYILKRQKHTTTMKVCLMLMLSGALGNCVDRIFFTGEMLSTPTLTETNGVVDWINFYGIWRFNFNWADSCLVVGVATLIVYLIIEEVLEYKKKKKEALITSNNVKESQETVHVLSKEEKERLEAQNKQKEKDSKENGTNI